MTTAGIDVGADSLKVVILRDETIVGHSILQSGFEVQKAIDEALELALRKAELRRFDISRVVSTGIGSKEVADADGYVSEFAAGARGAVWLASDVRTAIDIGCEQARAMRCDPAGRVVAYCKNGKCASGVGAFLEAMARTLGVSVEEIGDLSRESGQVISLDSTCVVFAETEVVSLIHARTPVSDIARAIHESVAVGIAPLLHRVGVEKEVMLFGGVARNSGVVARLKEHLGVEIIVPQEPQIVSALGAALIAND